MRADRLVSALLLLQAHGRLTAADLAQRLEVSVATARRDLEALSAAGIPVYPQAGRGGGWALVGGARTDLTGLTAPEAESLFLLLGPAAETDRARAALRKLVQALPRTFRDEARAAAEATMIDSAGWGEPQRVRPATVELLQRAVVRRRKVRITYRGKDARPAARIVEPWGLIDKDDTWYLLAGTDRGRRTFRVDRIAETELLDEPATRPDDFVLEAAWREVVADLERNRSRTWATARAENRHLPILRHHFGIHCEVVSRAGAEVVLRVAAPTALDLARNLAGWGGLVEVLEPAEVRDELARIGAELTAAYAGESRLTSS
ncbi:helix-turn-helix transcriptional regulator [Nocardia stercoris]|uniref:WYL domain-containing protein n=1 Tax=Nocardia stercoris TaxID=2483361 RepID=A0A3M2LCT6_9NOCA|nr:WYL domain-containing protein [Nocardia stercoris]RMI35357.1 WYL domain-containing protein [Nocardia stercoris]